MATRNTDLKMVALLLKRVRVFVESEVENRGAAGSDMSDYQGEAQEALSDVDLIASILAGLT